MDRMRAVLENTEYTRTWGRLALARYSIVEKRMLTVRMNLRTTTGLERWPSG